MARINQRAINFLLQYVHDKQTAIYIIQTINKMGWAAKTTGQQFREMSKRAAMVIPVWFALRRIFTAIAYTIRDSLKYYVDLSTWLARAQAVTSGVSGKMGEAMNYLRKVAEDFARSHKGTAKDVIEAYYRMATSGIEFKDSLAAAIPIVKLAMGTYSDTVQVAKAVAGIYRLLGDTVEGVTNRQEKMYKIVDILAKAWQTNELEVNEVAQAIANFVGVAKQYNLTFTETIALIATSHEGMIKAGRAGRLLSRVFEDLSKNLPKVAEFLGVTFKPTERIDWFKVLIQVIEKFRELGKSTPQIVQAMQDMFNIRSSRELRALIASYEKLNINLKNFAENSRGTVDALLKIADATPAVQLENLRENLSMIIKDFVTGIMNADDFVEALQKLNRNLEEMSFYASGAGAAIRALLHNLNVMAEWALKMPENKFKRFMKMITAPVSVPIDVLRGLKREGKDPFEEAEKAMKKQMTRWDEFERKREERRRKQIEERMQQELQTDELEKQVLELEKLKTLGYSALEIERLKLELYRQQSSDLEQIHRQERRFLQVYYQEIVKYSEQLRATFRDTLASILKGEADISDLFTRLGEKIRTMFAESIAEGITNTIWRMTGIGQIFGNMVFGFQNIGQGIVEASRTATPWYYEAIVKGSEVAAQNIANAMQGKPITTAGAYTFTPTGAGFVGGGGVWGTVAPFGLQWLGNLLNKPIGRTGYITKGGEKLYLGGGMAGAARATWGEALGVAGMTLATGMTGNIPLTLGTAAMGLHTLGFMGAGTEAAYGLGKFLGPIGFALTLGSMIYQMTRSKTEVREQQRTLQIASRIDVTNKTLDIINRNLVALRSDIRTYILPSSAFFAEARNIEDEFAKSQLRGY